MTRKKKGKEDLPDTFSSILGKKNKHTKEEEHLVKIIPGIGVGNIRLGMSFKDITRQFGEPEKISIFEDITQIYYIYYSKGIQIFFENKKIKSIILLSGLKEHDEASSYKPFPGITDRGITMRSTYKDIINAYGKPKKVADFNSFKIPSQRITYDGISFNFVMKTKKLLNINIITAEKLTTEEDITRKEPIKVPSKKPGIECAGCHRNFEWDDAYRIRDTPGSLNHNPPGIGILRPRVFCPHCGALIAEWHITREDIFDEWIWFGSNASLNTGRSLPPDYLTVWGKHVPSKYIPYFDEHQLDIEKVKQSATKKQPQAEIQPESEQNWKQLSHEGSNYFKEGNIKKAIELVQKAAAAGLPKEEHASILGAIGQHYLLDEKDVDSALKYFLSSIEKDFSGFWLAHAYLALIYEAMGNYQKAEQERRDAQRANPHKYLDPEFEQNVRQIIRGWITEKKSSVEEEKLDIDMIDYHGKDLIKMEYDVMISLERQIGSVIPAVSADKLDIFGYNEENGHVIQLRLYNKGLTSLPDTIGNLKSLKELKLMYNKGLTSLPDTIGNLKSLEVLWLGSILLTSLPDNICDFKSLKELLLIDNKLISLPDMIGNLKSLERLWLGSNKLTTLPESITKLEKLETLDLSYNNFSSLPDTIGNLKSLEILNLDTNELTSLPDSIFDLKSLKELNLAFNKLTSLPDMIGNLKSLEILNLDTNELTSLPDTIGDLKSLKELNLRKNKLISLPDTIGDLKSLNKLNLYDNEFGFSFIVSSGFLQKTAKEAKVHYDHGIEFCQKYLWVGGIGDGAYVAIQRAMQEFKAALKIDPNFQLARLALADCYFKVKDPLNYFDAALLYQKVIRDSPDLVVDVEQASLGDRYMEQGSDKARQAVIAYRKAIKIERVIW